MSPGIGTVVVTSRQPLVRSRQPRSCWWHAGGGYWRVIGTAWVGCSVVVWGRVTLTRGAAPTAAAWGPVPVGRGRPLPRLTGGSPPAQHRRQSAALRPQSGGERRNA